MFEIDAVYDTPFLRRTLLDGDRARRKLRDILRIIRHRTHLAIPIDQKFVLLAKTA